MAVPPVFVAGAVLTAAQMNQIGLWRTKTRTTFTAASTITANNVFTSDFNSYLIIFNYTTTGTDGAAMQFSVGGVAAATNYSRQSLDASATVVSSSRNSSQTNTGTVLVGTNGNYAAASYFYCTQVSQAAPTNYKFERLFSVGDFTTPQISHIQGNHSTTTAYDGFILTMTSGTTTGDYTVYGFRD